MAELKPSVLQMLLLGQDCGLLTVGLQQLYEPLRLLFLDREFPRAAPSFC